MPDLSAEQWAQQTLAKLHQYEQSCADVELFCVGYLIPQVELLEVQMSGHVATPEQWQAWFIGFIDDSLQDDQIDDADIGRLQRILDSLGEETN